MRAPRPRLFLMLFLLTLAVIPVWSVQIDDAFISLAYARSLVGRGMLLWGAERVEGYSNLLQVVLLAPAVAAGIDPDRWARGLSLLWAGLLLWTLERRAGRAGTGLLLGFAGWSPLGFWGCAGMELTLYALLLTAGWGAVQRRQAAGLWLLLLASWARPEGLFHLAAGVWVAGRGGGTGRAGGAGVVIGVWAVYQAFRLAWFGAWWPTPFLVKVAENEIQADILWQTAGEVFCMAGLAGLGWRLGRPAWRSLIPLAIQGAVVLGSDVDWMGHGRLWLPGVAATAGLWLGQARWWGRRRGAVQQVWPWAGAWPAQAALLAWCWLPDLPGIGHAEVALRPLDPLLHPLESLRTPLETPALEDVAWLVRNAPGGAAVLTGDVGMPGHLPWIRITDLNGLTSRAVAQWRMGDEASVPYVPAGPRLLRRLEGTEIEPWMGPGLRLHTRSRAERFPVEWWAADLAGPPEDAEILRRWEELRARFPSQGALWRMEAQDRVRSGDVAGGVRLMQEAVRRWPVAELRAARRDLVLEPAGEGWRSLPLPGGLALGVEVRRAASLRWRWECERVYRRVRVEAGVSRVEIGAPGCGGGEGRERLLVGGVEGEVWVE